MFGFNQIIKGVSRVSDFIFHSASQHHSRDPLPFGSDTGDATRARYGATRVGIE